MGVFTCFIAPVLYAGFGLAMHGSGHAFWLFVATLGAAASMVVATLVLAIRQLIRAPKVGNGRVPASAIVAIVFAVLSPFTGAFGLFWGFLFLMGGRY